MRDMNKNNSVITAVLAGMLYRLGLYVKPIHWQDQRQANVQMIIQFVIYTLVYLTMVFICSLGINRFWLTVILIGMILGSIISNARLSIQSVKENQIPVEKENARTLLKIVAFTWYGIFSSMCCLNLALTTLAPKYYDGIEGIGIVDYAVNVVYYTFSVMFSYSGNGIEAIGSFSRLIEIIEVFSCYIFIGIVITNIIGKTTEVSSNENT